MIVYINVKDGKVDLTKKELEKLLNDKYNEGYEAGKKYPSYTYTYSCPHLYCPYKSNTTQPYITWTASDISTSGYADLTGTITVPKTETTTESIGDPVVVKYKE